MTVFQYVAKDPKGRNIKGHLEATDERALLGLLRANDLSVISVVESKKKIRSRKVFFGSRKAPMTELVLFSRQMATMVDAGIPLVQALEILCEQTENHNFRHILNQVRQNVSAGASLSQALAKQGGSFSDLFVNMIRAGEESGSLDEILDRLATYLEKTQRLIGKVKSAMVYPVMVTVMAFGITALIMVKVIPVFKEMYADFGAELPMPTQTLISMSDFLIANLPPIFLGLVICAVALMQFGKTRTGARLSDRLKLRVPIFGTLLRKVAVSKFSRTLSTLIKSGVAILGALDITSKTTGNIVVEESIQKVRNAIREGENIADPLKQAKIFPPMVIRMIDVGERTGELEKMLGKIADFYEDQVETTIAGLTSILEPILIAFLGIVIGGIVICMFLPIFSLAKFITG